MRTERQRRLAAMQDSLYVIIVGALAAYLIIGVLAWSWMLLAGVAAPAAFTTVLSTISGGLLGILAPLGPRGPRDGEKAAG